MMIKSELNSFYAIYDADSSFLKKNKIDLNHYDAILETCIINSNNKIIAIGSPLQHIVIKEKYHKLLTEN